MSSKVESQLCRAHSIWFHSPDYLLTAGNYIHEATTTHP